MAESQAGLNITTDKPSYIENQDVLISLAVQNDNDALLNGNIKLEIVDQSDTLVKKLDDIAVTDVPALGQIDLNSSWNTGLTLAGDYKAIATLISSTGLTLQTSEVSFAIDHNIDSSNPLATLRITLDKPVYNTSDQVTIGSLSHNTTANALISDAKVAITVFNPDGSVNVELTQTLGDLASGNLRQRNTIQTLASVSQGTYTVTGKLLDASQTVLATDTKQFQVLEDLDATLTGAVQVAQPSIYSGVAQPCTNTINNGGSLDIGQSIFRQVLVNVETLEETVFDSQTVDAILTGESHEFVTSVSTGALLAGQYSCILQRQVGTDWVTMAYEFFKVDMLSLTASLDESQYAANTAVNINLQMDNPSNTAFTGNIKLSVINPAGESISELPDLGVIMPVGVNNLSLDTSWNTALTTAGNYEIIVTLYDNFDQSIVTQTLPLAITRVLQASLELTLDQAEYEPTQTVEITNIVNNLTLNSTLENASLTVNIKDQTDAVIYTYEEDIQVLAFNGTQSIVSSYQVPSDLADGSYIVVSQVLQGDVLAEAEASFTVKSANNIEIESTLDISSSNMRLLILMDGAGECLTTDAGCSANEIKDPLGPNNAPSVIEQRAVLEALLKSQGWSYTITTTATDFKQELRSGTYTAYALFSEQVKLDKSTQEELREAVFKGEGLLIAGDHDHRNSHIDGALGIKVTGKQSASGAIEILSIEDYQAMLANFILLDKTRRIQLLTAETVGIYSGTSRIAVTHNDYGFGHSVYAGFDILTQLAAVSPSDTAMSDILIAMLKDLQPQTSETYLTDSVIPIQLKLTNLGASTPGEVHIPSIENLSFVDSGDAVLQEDGSLIWVFDLAEEGETILNIWLQLPATPTILTLDAILKTGTEPELDDYETLNLTIPVTEASSLSNVVDMASALQASDKSFKQVVKTLGKASNYNNRGNLDKALSELLKAATTLSGIDHPDVKTLRRDLAIAIRKLELQM